MSRKKSAAPATNETGQQHYDAWKAAHPGLPEAAYAMVAAFMSAIWKTTITP
jgi:hypothetical protein